MRMHPILNVYKLHDGTDFGAACGTPVHAAAAGTIVSEYYNSGYGNRMIMNHGIVNGVSLSTSYNHLTSFVASSGQHVERGQLIAYPGPPATRPVATCTSWSTSTAPPWTRWAGCDTGRG